MTSRDFAYWLQGFFEIAGAAQPSTIMFLTGAQVELVKKHLALVFKHEIDPSYGDEERQAELSRLHNGLMPTRDPLIRC